MRLASAYTSGFLRPATVAMMFESQTLASGAKTNVGIGWRNSWDMDGRRVLEHAGFMQGTRAVVALFPDQQLAVSIMVNAEWGSLIEETAHMMALAYLTAPSPRPQPTGTYEVTATSLNGRNEATTLTGTLTLRRGAGTLELTPTSGGKLVRHPLVYVERGNRYALVRPDGVFDLALVASGDSVSARATGYGSPMAKPPSSNPPFLTVHGSRARPTH